MVLGSPRCRAVWARPGMSAKRLLALALACGFSRAGFRAGRGGGRGGGMAGHFRPGPRPAVA